MPIKTFIFAGCGNIVDPIEVSGTIHWLATSETNENRSTFALHATFDLEGTDAYGNRYNVKDNTNTMTNASAASTQPYTITIHVTVNANGTVTASFSDISASCQ